MKVSMGNYFDINGAVFLCVFIFTVRREDAAACGEKRVFPNVLSCSFYRQPKACCKMDWKLCLHSSCRKVLNGYEVFGLEFKAKPCETFGCVMLEMFFFFAVKS